DRDRSRRRGVGQVLPTAQQEQAGQGSEDGAEGVDDEVVDVEDSVGAGVESPDSGQLREFDERRGGQTRHRRNDDAPARELSDEPAERNEEDDVESRLQ